MFAFLPHAWHPYVAIIVALGCFLVFQFKRGVPADLLFLCGMLALVVTGIITPEDALQGFSNSAVISVGALFVVAYGMRATGALDWVGQKLLGSAQTDRDAMRRLTFTLIPVSAFLLNTPLVAMSMPIVLDWCRRRNISPSRLLLAVSYLAILGGVCTLIGTSTTLVVNGIMRKSYDDWQAKVAKLPADSNERAHMAAFAARVEPMGFLEIGYAGIPCAIVGGAFMLLVGRHLMPNRTDLVEQFGEQRREYLVEMLVQPGCRLIGQTVEQAGLRNLPGLFLIEIDRNDDTITPVTPLDRVYAGDRLVFTGVVGTIVDLEKIPGLVPAADMAYEFHPKEKQQRHLTEVVLSRTSPLIGVTVKAANFRQLYNAAVVAVHRNGVRLTNKIGNIEFEAGDTLLLQTRSEFVTSQRNNRDFYLVSAVEGTSPRRHDKALLATALLLILIVWLSLASIFGRGVTGPWAGLANSAVASLVIAALMILTGCLRTSDARNAIDLQVLFTIACSISLGIALTRSGAADAAAGVLLRSVGDHPWLLLAVIYIFTMFATELLSNAAVAAMMFPLVVATAFAGNYDPRPFIIAISLAASLDFLTPLGYQTNLMVMGPGGYRPADYVRVGWPLSALVTITALAVIPLVWDLRMPVM